MGESIYRCKKCGEERLGVALYECDNPECDDMYCGVCRPKGDYCDCPCVCESADGREAISFEREVK